MRIPVSWIGVIVSGIIIFFKVTSGHDHYHDH